jgi:hypothetical protein
MCAGCHTRVDTPARVEFDLFTALAWLGRRLLTLFT